MDCAKNTLASAGSVVSNNNQNKHYQLSLLRFYSIH